MEGYAGADHRFGGAIPKCAFPKTGGFDRINYVVRKYQTNLVASH